MAQSQKMKVDIWKGDWGLVSIDLDCLRLLTYLKIAGLELDVHKTSNPFRTPNGKLPVFYMGKNIYKTFEELEDYLKLMNICPDYGLAPKELAEISAFTSFLQERLYPALQYIWWIDDRNYSGLTRAWYAKAVPFPFNFYYPNKYYNEAKNIIDALYANVENEKEIELKIYSEAQKCLTTLSTKLGENDFIFGQHPRSLDVTIYAYLAPLLCAPFINNSLQNHLKSCVNLQKYVNRISKRYYSKELKDFEVKRIQIERNRKPATIDEFPNKKRNQFLFGIVSLFAMLIYAVSTGLVESSDDAHFQIGETLYKNTETPEDEED